MHRTIDLIFIVVPRAWAVEVAIMDKTVSNVFENVTEAHRKAVDALMVFNKIAVRTQGLLAGQQLAALENVFDAGSKNLQLVSEARDPRDLMAGQTEVAVQLGEKLVAAVQEALDIQSQARDEVATLVEDGFKAVNVPTVIKTPKAPKKAA
jgi:phasin family protein